MDLKVELKECKTCGLKVPPTTDQHIIQLAVRTRENGTGGAVYGLRCDGKPFIWCDTWWKSV